MTDEVAVMPTSSGHSPPLNRTSARRRHKAGVGIIVNAEPVTDPGLLAGGQEHLLPPVCRADDAARGGREHQVVRVLALGLEAGVKRGAVCGTVGFL